MLTHSTKYYVSKLSRVYKPGAPISRELFVKVKHMLKLGKSIKEVTRATLLSPKTVRRIKKRLQTNVKTRKQGRPKNNTVKKNPMTLQFISSLLHYNPCYYLKELQFLCVIGIGIYYSIAYMQNIITNDLNLKRKHVSNIAKKRESLRIRNWRESFKAIAKKLNMNAVIYVDESHFSFHDAVHYHGYVERGVQLELATQHVSTKRYSLIAAINQWGVIHYELIHTYTGETVTDKVFAVFITRLLAKVPTWTVIIMDNASVHNGPETRAIIEQNEHRFLFTSAYSPDYNAIELLFGYMKCKLKQFYLMPDNLPRYICYILEQIPKEIFTAFIVHTFKKYSE